MRCLEYLLRVIRYELNLLNLYLLLLVFHHPSLFYSRLKPSFFANPTHRSLPFLRYYLSLLHGFPGLFTDTFEHIRFFTFLFFFCFLFLVLASVR